MRSPPLPDARTASVRILLGAIVLLAAALRIWGIEYGLPHPLARPDEERITDRALRMLSDQTLGPGEFVYPSLQKYLSAAALEAHFAHVTEVRPRQQQLLASGEPLPRGLTLAADFGADRVYEIDPAGPPPKR